MWSDISECSYKQTLSRDSLIEFTSSVLYTLFPMTEQSEIWVKKLPCLLVFLFVHCVQPTVCVWHTEVLLFKILDDNRSCSVISRQMSGVCITFEGTIKERKDQ